MNKTARIVVTPTLLVRMFGLPDFVKMPSKVGQEITFDAYGKRFLVKRSARNVFFLSCPLASPRCRFGTLDQIAEDVATVLETGAMPQSAERAC
jgi:hypothetical protein